MIETDTEKTAETDTETAAEIETETAAVADISREISQEKYNSFPSRGSYNNRRNETSYGNRGTFRFNNANRRGGGFTTRGG